MAESFGLDRRIENYSEKRSTGLYRWDLDCLEAVIWMALDDKEEYPDKSDNGYNALKRLYDQINALHKKVSQDEP